MPARGSWVPDCNSFREHNALAMHQVRWRDSSFPLWGLPGKAFVLAYEPEKSHKDFWPGAGLLILEVLKTALRLNNILEQFLELRKVVILMVMVYYSEGIQMKINKGKRYIQQGTEKISCKASSCPSGLLWTVLFLSVMMCNNNTQSTANEGISPESCVQSLYWELVTQTWLNSHMVDPTLQPLQWSCWYHVSQAPTHKLHC